MRPMLAACLGVAATGCASLATPGPNEVQSLVRRCGLEGQIEFERIDGTHLAVNRLDPNADYDHAMCVLNGLEARGIHVGFIDQR